MPCARCGEPALDEICSECIQPARKRRRIHVICDDSDDEMVLEDQGSGPVLGSQHSSLSIPLDDLRDSGELIDGDAPEKEDGLDYATQFSLNSDALCRGRASPQLLSQDVDSENLSEEAEDVIGECPRADCKPCSPLEETSNPKQLRVLYWNLERFGGEEQWGLKAARADEVMWAIAQIIELADPHFVVLIEVMAYKGQSEVGRLLKCLNSLSKKKWKCAMPEEVTGKTEGKQYSGESYAVLYEDCIGIVSEFSRIGLTAEHRPFPVGAYFGKGGEKIAFRAPGEFLFQMGGPFSLVDGSSWPLGIVALHAPGPQANRERQEQIETVIHDLRLLDLIASPEKYPDVLVCADFNSHPDAYNISKEPVSHFDVAIHWQSDLSDGEDKPIDAGDSAMSLIACTRDEEEKQANSKKRKYGAREGNKVTTRVVAKKAKLLNAREQERLLEQIRRHNLEDKLQASRTKKVKEWRNAIEKLLGSIEELDAEYSSLALIAHQSRPDTLNDLLMDYKEEREALLDELQKIDPAISKIHYIEDMSEVLETIRRPRTACSRREAKFKRELKGQLKAFDETEKMYRREQAYASLDPEGQWEGFFNNLSCDTDLKTTRRRAITVLRTKGKLGKLQLPEGADSLLFSKYDQILVRTLGHLRQPDNVTIPVLVAVLSAAANERLFGALDKDEEALDELSPDDMRIPKRGGCSALASVPFQRLPGLVIHRLKFTDTWKSARGKTFNNINKHIEKGNLTDKQIQILRNGATTAGIDQLEDADPPNFHALQLALYLSRTLSDHDPMLAGYWVDQQLLRQPGFKNDGNLFVNLERSSQNSSGDDYFQQLLKFEEDSYQNLLGQEGNPHPLSDLIHGAFSKVISRMKPRRISLEEGTQFVRDRLCPVYDRATEYCKGTLSGETFESQPGGLSNIGNTCYMNATVQVLASCHFYRAQIANAVPSALKKILELVTYLINGGTTVTWDICNILRGALIEVGWPSNYDEQDPAELLLFIANELGFCMPWCHSQQVTKDGMQRDPVLQSSHIFSLAILKPSMKDCLKDYRVSEMEHYSIRSDVRLRAGTSGPIQMKRFGASEGRTYAIRTRLSDVDGLPAPLCAIIVQLGGQSLETGHYHAYVVRNDRIYCCNDATVTDVTGTQAVQSAKENGYMYFYRNCP